MGQRSFSKKEVIKIINLYRENEAIWKMSSKLYKRVDLKKNGWANIAREMKIDVEMAKKKIKSLRSTYLAEKKKIETLKNSGASGKIYEPNLFYFDAMAFLDEFICLRKNPTYAPSLQETNNTREETPSPPLPPRPQENLMTSISVVDNEECMAFGKSIAMQLKKLPPLNLCQAMLEVQSVVSKHIERVFIQKTSNRIVSSTPIRSSMVTQAILNAGSPTDE